MTSNVRLPSNWSVCSLFEIGPLEYGKALKASNRNESGPYPVYGSSGVVGYHDAYLVRGPALIVGRKGSVGTVHFESRNFWPIDTTYYLLPPYEIDGQYLARYLGHIRLSDYDTSTAVPGLNRNDAYRAEIRIPPLQEQRRIVAKIEALFSELHQSVADLTTARAQLKAYRQSLLKHAFEGKLTAQWRREHATPAADAESASVGAGLRPAPTSTHDGSASCVRVEGLPDLPDGWAYRQLGNLIEPPRYGTSKKCAYDSGNTGVLRIPNVVDGRVDADDLKYADFDVGELEKWSLRDGDFLIVRSNGSLSLVGTGARIRNEHAGLLYAGYLMRLRPIGGRLEPEFLELALATPVVRNQIEAKGKSTSGVNNINAKELASLWIPVCSFEEQRAVVNACENGLAQAEALRGALDREMSRAEGLRQSILKRAFEGRLVPQDPNDEPASELLARIRAEKAEDQKPARGRRTAAEET